MTKKEKEEARKKLQLFLSKKILTKKKLSELSNVTRPTIDRVLKGESFTLDTWVKIEKIIKKAKRLEK